MNSLKRDIATGLAMSAIALVFALAYGTPFVSPRAAHADEAQPQAQTRQQRTEPVNAETLKAEQGKTKPHPGTMRMRAR